MALFQWSKVLQNSQLTGAGCSLSAVMDVQFVVDIFQVGFDGVQRDKEFFGDVPI